MEPFALSERWNGWAELQVMLEAAHAAVAAGPLDPHVCEVFFESDFDTVTVDDLDAAEQHLRDNPDPMVMEVWIAHIDEEEASVALRYNGRWLQIDGKGTDWERARPAYYAAQGVLSEAYGITTFTLPELPADTVAETRRRVELEQLEAALQERDESPKDTES